MGGRIGKIRAFISLAVATAFTVFLWALQEAEVIDATTAVSVAVIAGVLVVVGSVLKLWLDRRHELSDDRPIIPPELYFREEPEVLHRPRPEPDAPWHHVARLGTREVISPVTLKVWTNRPVQWVRANIYRDAEVESTFDRVIANLGTGHKPEKLSDAFEKSTQLDKGVRWALVTFDDDLRLTTQDNLDLIAHGAMEDIRITRIDLVRSPR